MLRGQLSSMTLVASGSVTQANMKISAADGVAFADFSAAGVLTSKLGHLVRVYDSAGKMIQFYAKCVWHCGG